jgi:hypothetical protein
LAREADCAARIACLEEAMNDLNVTAIVECVYTYVYCTANVDAAIEQGYECDSTVTCTDPRTQDRFGWRTVPSLMESMMTISERTDERAPVIQGLQECVTSQCGTAPDGTKQAYLLDPADCDAAENCTSIGCAFEYVFCSEEKEIQKAKLVAKYECLGKVTSNNVTGAPEYEVCEE